MNIGKQDDKGLMKSLEMGSEHSFNNIVSSTFMPKSVSWPCSSCVASFCLVYNQAVKAHC
jgi:hypothetical protein